MSESVTRTAVTNHRLRIPETYNYIGVFLTMACNLRCSFCINRFGDADAKYPTLPGEDWVRGLNRIVSRADLPVSLQGGEPSVHRDFYEIIGGLREDLNIDILTNLQFDVDEFMSRVPPDRVKRDAPYASIRVSYHPETMALEEIKGKVLRLLENGYSVGIWAVRYPPQLEEIERASEECRVAGIDFRFKEFLGYHGGELHGMYKYPDAFSGGRGEPVECRTTELLIGPSGHVYRCHGDLYNGRAPIGHICDESFELEDIYRPCGYFGECNPCDVKIKTNRFQEFGHTSVDIRAAGEK